MTDGTRVLRTVAVPVVVAVIFLFLVPKTCQKALSGKKLRANPPAAAATDTGLHINSDAQASRPVAYPAGLDEQRVRYLVEINQRFAEPYGYRLPKAGGTILGFEPAPAEALVKAGWIEGSQEGGYAPTRDAALHLTGVTEEAQAWRVPLATRKFVRVTSLEDLGDNKARARFTWQWEPNEAGRAVRTVFELHQGTADLAGGGEHPWDLNAVNVDSEWR